MATSKECKWEGVWVILLLKWFYGDKVPDDVWGKYFFKISWARRFARDRHTCDERSCHWRLWKLEWWWLVLLVLVRNCLYLPLMFAQMFRGYLLVQWFFSSGHSAVSTDSDTATCSKQQFHTVNKEQVQAYVKQWVCKGTQKSTNWGKYV